MLSTTPYKQCSCGAKYSRDEWLALPHLTDDRGEPALRDFRACTRCRAILAAAAVAEPAPSAPELPFTD